MAYYITIYKQKKCGDKFKVKANVKFVKQVVRNPFSEYGRIATENFMKLFSASLNEPVKLSKKTIEKAIENYSKQASDFRCYNSKFLPILKTSSIFNFLNRIKYDYYIVGN